MPGSRCLTAEAVWACSFFSKGAKSQVYVNKSQKKEKKTAALSSMRPLYSVQLKLPGTQFFAKTHLQSAGIHAYPEVFTCADVVENLSIAGPHLSLQRVQPPLGLEKVTACLIQRHLDNGEVRAIRVQTRGVEDLDALLQPRDSCLALQVRVDGVLTTVFGLSCCTVRLQALCIEENMTYA